MSKICPNCGNQIPDDAAVCQYCGYQFSGNMAGGQASNQGFGQPQNPYQNYQPQPNDYPGPNSGPQNGDANYGQFQNQNGNGYQPGPNPGGHPAGPNDGQNNPGFQNPNHYPPATPAPDYGRPRQRGNGYPSSDNGDEGFAANRGQMSAGRNQVAASAPAGNYWQYLVSSLKHPFTSTAAYPKYFGALSYGLTALFMTFSLATLLRANRSVITDTIGAGAYIKSFVFFGAFFFALFSIAYIVRAVFLADHRTGYLATLNEAAHYANLNVFLSFLTILIGFFATSSGTASLFLICWLVILLFESIAFITTIFAAQPGNHFDKIYGYAIGVVFAVIVAVILFALLGTAVSDAFSTLTRFGN